MANADYNNNVFINCPIEPEYKQLFDAIVFTIHDCGFVARCSLEEDASGEVRFSDILRIISECRYGVHDISRTEPNPDSGLPRFNMPLELGVFLGARRYGGKDQRTKKLLILDREQYRYQQFISDLSGYDIRAHGNDASRASAHVRGWLVNTSRRTTIAGSSLIWDEYKVFQERLPAYCAARRWEPSELTFIEYGYAVMDILKEIQAELPRLD